MFIVNLKFQTVSLTQKKFRVFWGLNFCHFLKTDSGQLKPPFLTCSDFRYTFGPLPVYFRSTSGYINFSKNTTNQLEPLFKLSITSGLLPLKFRLLPVHFRLLQIFKNTLTIARTPFFKLTLTSGILPVKFGLLPVISIFYLMGWIGWETKF